MKLIVKNVDEKTIRKLAHEYLSDSYVTLKSLSTKYRTTPTTISNILWRGIAENILDQKVANCIYTKIVDKPSTGWYQRKLRWDGAFKKRTLFIQDIEQEAEVQQMLENLNTLKEYYEHVLASYESYYFNEENSPSFEDVSQKLEEVNRRIANLSKK